MERKYCLKIFLVDNDPFCLNIYRQQLSNMGYSDIAQFNDSNSCLECLVQNPDVIILNYCMDAANELDLLKKIKRFDADIYVIFISGPEEIEMVENSLKHGAFDYVVKKDYELEGIAKMLTSIYEIGELVRKIQPAFIKKFPG